MKPTSIILFLVLTMSVFVEADDVTIELTPVLPVQPKESLLPQRYRARTTDNQPMLSPTYRTFGESFNDTFDRGNKSFPKYPRNYPRVDNYEYQSPWKQMYYDMRDDYIEVDWKLFKADLRIVELKKEIEYFEEHRDAIIVYAKRIQEENERLKKEVRSLSDICRTIGKAMFPELAEEKEQEPNKKTGK